MTRSLGGEGRQFWLKSEVKTSLFSVSLGIWGEEAGSVIGAMGSRPLTTLSHYLITLPISFVVGQYKESRMTANVASPS